MQGYLGLRWRTRNEIAGLKGHVRGGPEKNITDNKLQPTAQPRCWLMALQ